MQACCLFASQGVMPDCCPEKKAACSRRERLRRAGRRVFRCAGRAWDTEKPACAYGGMEGGDLQADGGMAWMACPMDLASAILSPMSWECLCGRILMLSGVVMRHACFGTRDDEDIKEPSARLAMTIPTPPGHLIACRRASPMLLVILIPPGPPHRNQLLSPNLPRWQGLCRQLATLMTIPAIMTRRQNTEELPTPAL